MRRFLFSGSVISALMGGMSVVQATRRGPRDWRLVLLWISWAISLALAIGGVLKADEARRLEGRR